MKREKDEPVAETRRGGPDDVGEDGLEREVRLEPVSYTHLRAHETVLDLVCRLLLEKKKYTTAEHSIRCDSAIFTARLL